MDIRTKLVFALVAVSLVSMLALGTTTYTQARDLLLERERQKLEGLAESKKQDLEKVLDGWDAQVRLVISRTRLRELLRAHNEAGSAPLRAAMSRILRDALRSTGTLQRLTLHDLSGAVVASTLTTRPETLEALEPERLPAIDEPTRFEGITVAGGARSSYDLSAGFLAWLHDDAGDRIGVLEAMLDARELIEVIENYTGLGRTGETLISLRDVGGRQRILHAGRHGVHSEALTITPEREGLPAARALRGEQRTYTEAILDYRGVPVWAATRYLREPSWGVVVKFDATEEREDVVALRGEMMTLGLSLSALAILAGVLLGLWFARPIHELAEVVDRIRNGDLEARAEVRTEDEVGVLARAFNEMTEQLTHSQRGLQRRNAGAATAGGAAARPAGSAAVGDRESGAPKPT